MQRYRAFISYSHADERWARWLQHGLERFRVPGRLRAEESGVPARFAPIFRDREELASSGNLSLSIREALAASDTLLVVCSPAAAASRWVNEEIRTFRAMSPGGQVLCLLVDGSTKPEADDCAFPPDLLTDDSGTRLPIPLAADVRPSADGKRGAFLKIAAGLLGVGIDSLRQREQQRRLRVMGAVTAGAVAVAFVTVLLAVAAIRARDEAEVRRAQAEDLIEFMLGDLREQLEPIGRLNILDRVGDQAMAYFSALGDLGTREEVYSRAMALRQIGEVRFNQGQLEPAYDAFTESRDLAASLLADHPEDNHLLFELGQSEFWLGYVAWERIDLDAADASFHAYSGISEALYRREPDNPEYLMERMYAAVNLGGLALERGQISQAIGHIADSVDIGRTLVGREPDNADYRLELARALSWKGSVLTNEGDLAAAVAALREGQDILYHLHLAGRDANHSREFGDMSLLLADGLAMTGDIEGALERFLSANALYESLAGSDPDNALWKEGLNRALQGAGQMKVANGQVAAGGELLQRAAEGFEGLVATEPANRVFNLRLARARADTVWAAVEAGNLELAQQRAEQTYALLEGPLGQESLSSSSRIRAAAALDHCAAAWLAGGDADRAESVWIEALALLGGELKGALIERALYVRIMYRMGREEEVEGQARELLATGLNDPRYLPGDLRALSPPSTAAR